MNNSPPGGDGTRLLGASSAFVPAPAPEDLTGALFCAAIRAEMWQIFPLLREKGVLLRECCFHFAPNVGILKVCRCVPTGSQSSGPESIILVKIFCKGLTAMEIAAMRKQANKQGISLPFFGHLREISGFTPEVSLFLSKCPGSSVLEWSEREGEEQ